MTVEVVSDNVERCSISRAAFKVMLGGIFSLSAGLINQMIIAAYFGAGAEMDVYMTALVIPAYLQAIFLTGLSFVFIPAFVREETKGNEDAAWELVGTFFWITTGILIAIAIAGSLLAKEIISLTAPGFNPEKSILAARMLSVLMLSIPFAGLSIYTIGIQNARNSFFWPSFGGAVNSIGNILAVVLLSRLIGPMALAWGFFVAILLQSCITVFPVLRHGWPRLIPLTDNRILAMAKLISPFILFGLLINGTTVLERYFASALPSGQISYLGYAWKISSIYVQLMAMGIASAIFPVMARAYTQKGKEGLGEKTVYGLRLTLAVALPAVLITGALSIPLVKVLFERGKFHPIDTFNVAQIVLIVMISDVLCRMLSNIIGRTFYVLKDTLTPPIISSVCVLFYIGIGRFFAGRWGYIGLAYAFLLQQTLNILILCVFLFYKLRGTNLVRTLRSAIIYCLAALGAYFFGRLLYINLKFIPILIKLILSGFLSGTFYLIVLYFQDREIFVPVLEMIGIGNIIDLVLKKENHIEQGRLS
jgi:putative peptidoglycan lipid II flippase